MPTVPCSIFRIDTTIYELVDAQARDELQEKQHVLTPGKNISITDDAQTGETVIDCDIESAADVPYDGTSSGLASENVQAAIDELKSDFDNLPAAFVYKGSSSLIPDINDVQEGWVYNITSSFTTTEDFVEGPGITYSGGNNIVCVETQPNVYKWDVMMAASDKVSVVTLMPENPANYTTVVYVGPTTALYKNNCIYTYVTADSAWHLVGGAGIQVDEIPVGTALTVGDIVQYVGPSTAVYENGYFYKCIEETAHGTTTYSWERIDTQPRIETETMPAPSAALLGVVKLYIGEDTADYKKGYIYKCENVDVAGIVPTTDVHPDGYLFGFANSTPIGVTEVDNIGFKSDTPEVGDDIYEIDSLNQATVSTRLSVVSFDATNGVTIYDSVTDTNYLYPRDSGIDDYFASAQTKVYYVDDEGTVYDGGFTGSSNPTTMGLYEDGYTQTPAWVNLSGVSIATTQNAGIVKPDGTTILIDPDGTIHGAQQLTFDEEDFELDDENEVHLTPAQRTFTGTVDDWEGLTDEEKERYVIVNLINDTTSSDGTLVGEIKVWGGSTAPNERYHICDGTALSRTEYAKLFSVIGINFGAGNGTTTFNIPDLRECTIKGVGVTDRSVGNHVKTGGLALGEFIDDRVQEHTHTYSKASTAGQNGTGIPVLVGLSTSSPVATGSNTGRLGATTEVKAVGVNYIIKIK